MIINYGKLVIAFKIPALISQTVFIEFICLKFWDDGFIFIFLFICFLIFYLSWKFTSWQSSSSFFFLYFSLLLYFFLPPVFHSTLFFLFIFFLPSLCILYLVLWTINRMQQETFNKSIHVESRATKFQLKIDIQHHQHHCLCSGSLKIKTSHYIIGKIFFCFYKVYMLNITWPI